MKRAVSHKQKRRKSGGRLERDADRRAALRSMHDIMRILGFEEEEQLVDWPLLIKMPLEILDKAAANVVQLVIKLIMRANVIMNTSGVVGRAQL
ncbi:hypothetical protein PF008_g27196 [Phytophthora fragariae]|uniref:Uncharacterized protein n=1 Tax=Phytophthora fragariae TaxID=53985 RepID=A0A6G0QF07_9STRA|nr:hypothetical protein PF008_g27196 [Phytophthora fragariae]